MQPKMQLSVLLVVGLASTASAATLPVRSTNYEYYVCCPPALTTLVLTCGSMARTRSRLFHLSGHLYGSLRLVLVPPAISPAPAHVHAASNVLPRI